MSLVLQYRLNSNDAYIGEEASGSTLDMTNLNVTLATDATYGSVGYFDGTASLTLPAADVPACMIGDNSKTMSYWMKIDSGGLASTAWHHSINNFRMVMLQTGKNRFFFRYYNTESNNTYAEDTWYHIVCIYDTSTGDFTSYSDGQVDLSYSVAMESTASNFMFGDNVSNTNGNNFVGMMTDLRIYDYAFDSTEISSLFADGPNPTETYLSATMYTHVSDVSWISVVGATTYRITQKENSGSEVEVLGSTTDMSVTLGNLTPGASYDFSLYTDLDELVPVDILTSSTPVVDSVTTQDLLLRFENNLQTLGDISDNALDDISVFFDDSASTGDVFVTDLGNVTYVKDTESVDVSSSEVLVLTPFSAPDGSGQTVTINSSVIDYDETTNEVISNGTNYSVGEAFVLGKYKVTVKEDDIL